MVETGDPLAGTERPVSPKFNEGGSEAGLSSFPPANVIVWQESLNLQNSLFMTLICP